jgi:hypothetical protein
MSSMSQIEMDRVAGASAETESGDYDMLMEAGRWAMSGANGQPWDFKPGRKE